MRSRLAAPTAMLLALLSTTLPASGIIVGTVTVTGTVLDADERPLEGARVEVVGMEGYNATTDSNGSYMMVTPLLEVGHTLRFTHPDWASREEDTGPLEVDDLVYVNVSMAPRSPFARLHVKIEPSDQPGSNYGLRQDWIHVVNASGTPPFEWKERSNEEDVTVPAPGTYVLTGTRPGYYPVRVTVEVGRGDRRNVIIDMTGHKAPTFGHVNGTVRHDAVPVVNVTVEAEAEDGTRTYRAVTNEEGEFSLQLPNGTFTLTVSAEGYSQLSQGVAVELGGTVDVSFPLSVAQTTGDEGNPLLAWGMLAVAVVVLATVIALAVTFRRRAQAAIDARREEGDRLRCPACDAPAPGDAAECPSCGAAFPWKSFRCPECGALMELDATRCPDCGNQTFDLHRGRAHDRASSPDPPPSPLPPRHRWSCNGPGRGRRGG